MKGIVVSIVDVLGIFVPGFILLMGIVLFPPLVTDLLRQWPTWTVLLEAIRANIMMVGVLVAISSYVMGFIIRLGSIGLLQFITYRLWAPKLSNRVKELEQALEAALQNPTVCESLKMEAKWRRSFEVNRVAPYFSFSKRIIHNSSPALWAETERLEAELRFAAGIFIPLLVLFVDGVWLNSFSGYVLSIVSGLAAVTILVAFPRRRIQEVIYNYQMALIVLHYPLPVQSAAKTNS